MSITILPDVIIAHQEFAQDISGRIIRKNQRVSSANGVESINIVWDRSKREYDLTVGPLRRAAKQVAESLFEVLEAGALGCLLLDPKDHSVAMDEGRVADLGGGTYQLFKRYAFSAARYKDRKITRPLASSVMVFVSGVQTAVVIDEGSGIITIASAPAATNVRWSGRFYVPVHFKDDELKWHMDVAGPDPESRFFSSNLTLEEVIE